MKSSSITNNKGFTLVELIVVITILAILGTIGFVSIQNYTIAARDSKRISDLTTLAKGLTNLSSQGRSYPIPDQATTVSASGSTLSQQGLAGTGVTGAISMSSVGDPKDGNNPYIYAVNPNRTQFQLLGYFENPTASLGGNIIPTAFAADYTNRITVTRGYPIGIYLDNTLQPVTGTTIDITTSNNSNTYTVVLGSTESHSLSGSELFSKVYNRRSDLLRDSTLAAQDRSLVGYWNMETLTLSGSRQVLKDLSYYGNHGDCYDGGTLYSCGTSGFGPQIAEYGAKKSGKSMQFDGVNDWIRVIHDSRISFGDSITVVAKIKLSKLCTTFVDGDPCIDSILMKGGAFTPGVWLMAGYSGTKYLTEVNMNASGYGIISQGTNSTDPSTVVFVKNGNQNQFYINGKLDKTQTSNYNLLNNTENLTIGSAFNTANRVFEGYIDEIRIYNRALTNDEIQSIQATYE